MSEKEKAQPDWFFPLFLTIASGFIIGMAVSHLSILPIASLVSLCGGIAFFGAACWLLGWELNHYEITLKKETQKK